MTVRTATPSVRSTSLQPLSLPSLLDGTRTTTLFRCDDPDDAGNGQRPDHDRTWWHRHRGGHRNCWRSSVAVYPQAGPAVLRAAAHGGRRRRRPLSRALPGRRRSGLLRRHRWRQDAQHRRQGGRHDADPTRPDPAGYDGHAQEIGPAGLACGCLLPRRRTTTYVDRRDLLAGSSGAWSTTYVADRDYAIYARTTEGRSAIRITKVAYATIRPCLISRAARC